MLRSVVFIATLLVADAITEYVGMVPVQSDSPIVKWAELKYELNMTSVDDVSFQFLDTAPEDVGAWFDLDLSTGGGDGAKLAARVFEDSMYM